MNTLLEIIIFLIRVFGSIYLSVILLRFLLQTARADFYNPISQLLVKLTNPILIPLRRVVPGFWGIDLASIVFAILFHWVVLQIIVLISMGGIISPLRMIAWSMIGITMNIITIYLVAGFVIFITSFLAPYSRHPILILVRQLMEPLMAPIRRFIPPVGGLDFSLFFVGIFLIIMRMIVIGIGESIGTPFQALIGYA